MKKMQEPPLTFPAFVKDEDDLVQRALEYFTQAAHQQQDRRVAITAAHIERLIQRYL